MLNFQNFLFLVNELSPALNPKKFRILRYSRSLGQARTADLYIISVAL